MNLISISIVGYIAIIVGTLFGMFLIVYLLNRLFDLLSSKFPIIFNILLIVISLMAFGSIYIFKEEIAKGWIYILMTFIYCFVAFPTPDDEKRIATKYIEKDHGGGYTEIIKKEKNVGDSGFMMKLVVCAFITGIAIVILFFLSFWGLIILLSIELIIPIILIIFHLKAKKRK